MSLVTINLLAVLTFSVLLSVECRNSSHWDVLMLVQSWLPTNCKAHVSSGFPNACRMTIKTDRWAVHGVWPSNFNDRWPHSCQHPATFQLAELAPLQRELDDTWTDILQIDKMGPTLWAHEWRKHGTCLDLPAWHSPTKYFQMGLQLYRRYDLKTILHRAKIAPSNNYTYQLKQFLKAIQGSLGTKPGVKCFMHEHNQYVFEIELCFTKELKIVDCKHRKVLCDPNMGIIYSSFR